MPAPPDDWRRQDQDRYLRGRAFRLCDYTAPSATWDHDHCEFCWAKFMERPYKDVLQRGYCSLEGTTPVGYHWVCEACFDDFADEFGLTAQE